MNAFAYKPKRPQNRIFRLIENRKKSILFGIIFLALILTTFSRKGFISRFFLDAEVQELRENVEALKREQTILKNERERILHDPLTQEHIAREEHGMIRPGETVYRILPAK